MNTNCCIKIDMLALSLTLGIMSAMVIGFIGLMHLWFGLWSNTALLISEWYLGFGTMYSGIFIGMLYAFVDGVLGGFFIAWLYNKLAHMTND